MGEPTDQFKRAPRRKAERGKRVAVSEEAKKAYADLLKERESKEQAYGQHLPADMKK